MNLKSDLSWYGNKPGFAKDAGDIASRKTSYTYNNDLTVQTRVTGYTNQGFVSYFTPRVSADAFVIDDASHSFRGTSSRKTQQGAGSKFPIGPKGQVHDFDIPRLGFHLLNRYGETYNAKSLSGLAATYTKDSPIDDVYNIVKVRDVSYDPFGYASPPYILRGIQRDDNRYPQRWGTGNQIADTVSLALGVPRGGALAFGERAGNDVARLAKMMIRPMGLGWVAKQALLHLMNPNTEGVTGLIQRPNNHKVSSPLNTLLAAGVSGLGIHPRKHGLLPIGGLGRYEDIHSSRKVLELVTPGPIGQFNRLRRLTNELYNHYEFPVLPYWNTITGFTGPDTVGGVGVTQFSRDVQGNLDQLLRFPGAQSSGQFSNSIQNTINTLTPLQYVRIRRTDESKYGRQGFATGIEGSRSPLMFTQYSAIPGTYGYSQDLLFDRKEFTVEQGLDPRVFLVTTGTRPDIGTGWKIQIPTKVNVRSDSTTPITLTDTTFADLSGNTRYYRSYINPYGSQNLKIGYRNGLYNSPLEDRIKDRSGPYINGIPNSELSENPNTNARDVQTNDRSIRSIKLPGKEYGLDYVQSTYRENSARGAELRKLYRDDQIPYGKNNVFGYNPDGTGAPGGDNTGDSQLKTLRLDLEEFGLDPGNTQIGKRLNVPGAASRTDGVDYNGTVLTGIQAYKTMTYPAILKAAKDRSLSKTPTTYDFTTAANWSAANTPMAKIGKLGTGDKHRKDTWDSTAYSNHPINIQIGGQIFPAYITDLSTKTDQGLLTFKPAGSPVAVLAGSNDFTTGVGISFTVAANSRAEFNTVWSSLKSLQGKVKPSASSGVWSPKKCALKVGDFVNISNSYLTSISLALDNEFPWELDNGNQKPIYISVDCQFVVIDGSGVYG